MKSWHEKTERDQIWWLGNYPASGLRDEIGIRKPSAGMLYTAHEIAVRDNRKTAAAILLREARKAEKKEREECQ
jgi:hypothetical protein